MKLASAIRSAAVTLAAALGLSLLTTPASADPIPSTEYRQLVGVGSATTQELLNSLGRAIPDPDSSPSPSLIASYDAEGASPIKTRPVGCVLNRPNGSVHGVLALHDAIVNNTGCLDFVRSSRGPRAPGTRLTWIPFAKDAVAFAVRSDSPLNTAAGLNLNLIELREIFSCVKRQHNGVTLRPLLPPEGSGTRAWLLAQLSMGDAQVGACVVPFQDNYGVALTSPGDIAPYSVAQYIAQTGGVTADLHGTTVLPKWNGVSPRNPNGTLNTAFPFVRDIYNIVRTNRLSGSPAADPALISAFVGPGSQVCAQSRLIQAYGFVTLGAACGSTALQGER
ncbi:hypothetical protein [Streptomyces sp. NPDC056244]|uniref:hypothetical protein n=1 Tax=unclassified Streptomyces TaxID=2593676 RepID=UPI0035DC7BE8